MISIIIKDGDKSKISVGKASKQPNADIQVDVINGIPSHIVLQRHLIIISINWLMEIIDIICSLPMIGVNKWHMPIVII